jgi:hypothetical protein
MRGRDGNNVSSIRLGTLFLTLHITFPLALFPGEPDAMAGHRRRWPSSGGQIMRIDHTLIAAALVLASSQSALSLDMAHVTCRGLATASNDDLAELVMWLRGYHAGKTGDMAATDIAELQEYGLDLGSYCKAHIDDLVIDASEKILGEGHPGASQDHNSLPNPETGSEAGGKSVAPAVAAAPTGSIHSRSHPSAPQHRQRASARHRRDRTRHEGASK